MILCQGQARSVAILALQRSTVGHSDLHITLKSEDLNRMADFDVCSGQSGNDSFPCNKHTHTLEFSRKFLPLSLPSLFHLYFGGTFRFLYPSPSILLFHSRFSVFLFLPAFPSFSLFLCSGLVARKSYLIAKRPTIHPSCVLTFSSLVYSLPSPMLRSILFLLVSMQTPFL